MGSPLHPAVQRLVGLRFSSVKRVPMGLLRKREWAGFMGTAPAPCLGSIPLLCQQKVLSCPGVNPHPLLPAVFLLPRDPGERDLQCGHTYLCATITSFTRFERRRPGPSYKIKGVNVARDQPLSKGQSRISKEAGVSPRTGYRVGLSPLCLLTRALARHHRVHHPRDTVLVTRTPATQGGGTQTRQRGSWARSAGAASLLGVQPLSVG